MKKRLIGALASLAILPVVAAAQTQQTQQTPQQKSRFHVRAEVGPWMVLAANYKGPHSLHLAEQHVRELRLKYRMPGHTVSLDLIKNRWQKNNKNWVTVSPRVRGPRKMRSYEEWGVLVGGYKDRDTALKALAYLRQRVGAPNLTDPYGRPVKSTLHVWERPNLRNPDKVKLKEKKDNNPYKTAFVIKNPMLAYEKKKVGEYKPDPLWKKLTSGEKYSLYNASKPWTLVIMELQGAAVVDQSFAGAFLEKIGFSDGSKKLLNANAKQASEVARLLRHYGMKAFVLHTRASSIVTVGEFDSPKSRELIQMQQQLANFRLRGSQVALPLFARPQPMRVPR